MSDKEPCPVCPDGNEWTRNGPTGRVCQVCKGTGVLPPHEDEYVETPEGER